MAITNYSELQSAITDWMDRNDISGKATEFISLAEARLNRQLEAVEATATLTSVSGSRLIDVSALRVIEPMALWVSDGDGEDNVPFKPAGTFSLTSVVGDPAFVALNGDNLQFDCPLSDGLTFRFRYRGRFSLSDEAPTNALLTDHPDVYLAACIVWGSVYVKDMNATAAYKSLLDEFMAEASNHLSQRKRSVLRPSTDLVAMIGRRSYDVNSDT